MDTAATNGKEIFLPVLPDTDEALVLARGFIDHESAHIRHTDFKVSMGKGLRKSMVNILEDIRIEQKLSCELPGCKINLEGLEKSFVDNGVYRVVTDQSHPAEILIARIHHCLRVGVLNNLCTSDLATNAYQVFAKAFPKGTVDEIDELLKEADSLRDTAHVCDLADRIMGVIQQDQPEEDQQSDSNCEEQSDQNEESDSDESEESGQSGGEDKSESDQDDSKGSNKSEDEQDTDEGEGASDPDNSDEDESEGSGESGEEDESKDQDSGDCDSSDADTDDSDDSDGNDQGSNGQDSDETDDTDEGKSSGGDGDEGGDQDGDKSDESNQGDASDGGSPDSDDSDDENSDSGDASGEDSGKEDSEDGNDQKQANLQALRETQDEEVVEDTDLGDKLRQQLGDMAFEASGHSSNAGTFPVQTPQAKTRPIDPFEAARETNALRTKLNGLIQASKLKRSPPRRVGHRVDTRSLHKLASLDTRVFRGRESKTAVNTAVVVLLDQSGSMRGQKEEATKAAMAVSMALDSIPGVKLAIAGFNSVVNERGDRHIPSVSPMKSFGQRTDKQCFMPHSGGGTPIAEGLWWSASELLSQTTVERRVVICITDGGPDDYQATMDIVSKLKTADIETNAIGIGVPISKELFPVNCTISSISELPEKVFSMLEDLLIVT
jgi:Mg-chelatase subunit ChlD